MNELSIVLLGWIVQNSNSITKFQVELENTSSIEIPSKNFEGIRADLTAESHLCAGVYIELNAKSLEDKGFAFLRECYRDTPWYVFTPTDGPSKAKVQFIVPCLSVSDFRKLCDDLSKVGEIGTFEEKPVMGYTGLCFTK